MRVIDRTETVFRIARQMEDHGLRRKHLAKKLDVSLQTVNAWYSKIAATPSLETLIRMSGIFDCGLDDLVAVKEVPDDD